MLWCDERGGQLESAQEERKTRGESVPIGPNAAEKATHELTHTSFRNGAVLRASQSRERSTQTTIQRTRASCPTIVLCRTHQARSCLPSWTAAIGVEETEPATYVVSAVVEHLQAWGRKKVIFRIDGEPAIRALGVAIQYARIEETVIKSRPKYTSPPMVPVENMNKELCGIVRCFRIYLREKAKM